ncbi:MAG: tRNA (adenosine(37)-N6)-dimethylallyltransferase MiaA [Gammaproteobacteria bacterium]|jgi:tRNA dimethylallyltransferase|nr:tRNA (adenosine(37)-N6)-dimethylallyltransferase MiaA [Chromatiales bacterium]MDP6673982.1 tRNA (adenosine(37)-N6)-dimethylallyltransferase MiaA [Gammaproteobacteria bacterium]
MSTGKKPVVVCLLGPTAAGKTDVALHLVEHFPFDIVSVDSAMVYRYMNIGTAKPSADILARAPHRLVDILDPWETYSAGRFREDALNEIERIQAAGRFPLLVGGTFLYFRALEHGLAALPAADAAVRAQIDARAEREGWAALHAELASRDPLTAVRIKSTDRQRIQRALEVIELTGERLSDLHARSEAVPADFEFLRVALLPSDRKVLHDRVAQRFDTMLADGFVAEVEQLRSMPRMTADRPAMRAVGYRQIWACLEDQYDQQEAVRRAVVATRRLVKRQLTWMRSAPGAAEFDCLQSDVSGQVRRFIADRFARYQD